MFPDSPVANHTADPARELRSRLAFARPRARQGVQTRYVAAVDELQAAARYLRDAAIASNPAAALDCVALLAGVSADAARRITVGLAPNPTSGVIHIDTSTGVMWTDLGRIELQQAATPSRADLVVPATHWIARPLPAWLHRVIAESRFQYGESAELGEQFPAPPCARGIAVDGNRVGRMRVTLPRLQAGLAHHLLTLGIDRQTAALVLNQFALVPRARLFYVATQARELAAVCATMYATLGWGSPAASPMPTAVGSQVVPTDAALQRVWATLSTAADAALPARRYTLQRMVQHHNHYVLAAGWLLAFLVGARETQRYDFSAATCRPGAGYITYADKRTGPFGSARPAILGVTAQTQVRLYYSHLRALVDRGHRLGVCATWLTHARDAMAGRDVELLFVIEGTRARPLATADVVGALPAQLALAPNAGRHYWQTKLHDAGVPSNIIDFFARHAARGTESMTSTSLLPLVTAREEVSRVQAAVLKRLAIEPLAGQGRRSQS